MDSSLAAESSIETHFLSKLRLELEHDQREYSKASAGLATQYVQMFREMLNLAHAQDKTGRVGRRLTFTSMVTSPGPR